MNKTQRWITILQSHFVLVVQSNIAIYYLLTILLFEWHNSPKSQRQMKRKNLFLKMQHQLLQKLLPWQLHVFLHLEFCSSRAFILHNSCQSTTWSIFDTLFNIKAPRRLVTLCTFYYFASAQALLNINEK